SPFELKRLAMICCDPNYYWVNETHKPLKEPEFSKRIELVGKVAEHYPAARKALLDQGRKAEEIDAMPMLQVVLIYNYQQYRRVIDDVMKWCGVPYWDAQKGLEKVTT